MSKRIIFVGLLALPGCAMEGALTVHPARCPYDVVRVCNGPAPPPVVISQPSPSPTPQESGDLAPAPPLTPVEATPPEEVRPTSKWRPVAR